MRMLILNIIFLVTWVAVQSDARQRYHSTQRGDLGPDEDTAFSRYRGGAFIEEEERRVKVTPAPGGPNVCRSRSSGSQCCPGWTVKGRTGKLF